MENIEEEEKVEAETECGGTGGVENVEDDEEGNEDVGRCSGERINLKSTKYQSGSSLNNWISSSVLFVA